MSIVLLLTAIPFTNVSAAAEAQYSFTYASQDGKATLISYNPASETDYVLHDVVIPSQTPDGDTVTAIAEGAFNDTSCGIRTMFIPETVTQLSPDCFISRSNVGAFSFLDELDIYYAGSQEQWNNISFDAENEEVLYNWLVWIDDIGYTTINELSVYSQEDTVDFGYSTMIFAEPTCLPYGTYIKWSSNNDSLIVEPYESAHVCLVTSALNGKTEITASFEYMSWFDCSDSAETESASITITSKAGIIEIIRYIIRSIFDIMRLFFKF